MRYDRRVVGCIVADTVGIDGTLGCRWCRRNVLKIGSVILVKCYCVQIKVSGSDRLFRRVSEL